MAREFKIPDLGEGIHEAEIQEVLVSEGDEVEEDQVILVVETDKAAVEIPSPYAGTVQEISVEAGDLVSVGDAVVTFSGEGVEEGAEGPAAEEEPEEAEEPREPEGAKEAEEPEEPHEREGAAAERPVPASPATRRLARELGVDLHQVSGSGPAGRVTAEDVRAFAERGEEEPEEPRGPEVPERVPARRPEAPELPDFTRWGEVERVPLRSVRRSVAKKMALAWSQIPHVSHHDAADITELEQLRQEYKDELGVESLTLTVFVMKAVVAALKEYPRFNASLDLEAQEIVLKQYHHLGIAVDTDRGLIVPVIRDVDRKSISELSEELQELAQRTRDGETALEEMQGGTFTITNIGMLGGTDFEPIINYPEVAILGTARARWQPVVQTNDAGEPTDVVPRFVLPLILAVDHRVVDGADAARFMNLIVDVLEDPDKLMLLM